MQSKIFVPLLSALSLSGLVSAQDRAPVPVPVSVSVQTINCGGCYVVAGVAGIVFGRQTLTMTQTNNAVIANATTVFTTATAQFDTDSFTLVPGSVLGPIPTDAPAVTSFDLGGTAVTINGQTLSGPEAVNVFTAFSTTSTTLGPDGSCSIVLGTPIPINPAFTVPIPNDVSDFNAFQLQAESSFLAANGIPPGCTPGGLDFTVTTRIPVSVVTQTITSTQNRTQAAATVSAITTILTPTSTEVTATSTPTGALIGSIFSSAGNVTFVVPSSGQSVIVIGPTATIFAPSTSTATALIIEASNAANRQSGDRQSALSALLSGALAMLVGFVA